MPHWSQTLANFNIPMLAAPPSKTLHLSPCSSEHLPQHILSLSSSRSTPFLSDPCESHSLHLSYFRRGLSALAIWHRLRWLPRRPAAISPDSHSSPPTRCRRPGCNHRCPDRSSNISSGSVLSPLCPTAANSLPALSSAVSVSFLRIRLQWSAWLNERFSYS